MEAELRIMVALYRLDRKDALFSTPKEVARQAKMSETTARRYLARLTNAGHVELAGGKGKKWRLTPEGTLKAATIVRLKPRERLILEALRRAPEGDAHYSEVAAETGLHPNGVSQSLGALSEAGLTRPAGPGLWRSRV